MKEGVPLQIENISSNQHKIAVDCLNSLHQIHSKGYCHCDIRITNIVYFPDVGQYELIDFDLAIQKGETSTILYSHNGRNPYLPQEVIWRLQYEKKTILFPWERCHDIEMLLNILHSISHKLEYHHGNIIEIGEEEEI
jgi:serine/threonine protein kinase